MEEINSTDAKSASREYLTKATMEYGESKVFKRFLLLTMASVLWSIAVSIPLIFGLVDLDPNGTLGEFPVRLIPALSLIFVIAPFLGFVLIYFASKARDQEKMYSGLGILNIYLQLLLGLLYVSIFAIGALLLFTLLLSIGSAIGIVLLPLMIIFFAFWYLNFKYLKSALAVIKDLMHLVDLQATTPKSTFPDFAKLIHYSKVFWGLGFFGFLLGLLGLGAQDVTEPSIYTINGFPIVSTITQLLGLAVLAYMIHMVSDMDQEFQQAYVNE